ncbi:MAG: hypothetical protein OHK0026_10310 [Rhodocyclaceae bacterium]
MVRRERLICASAQLLEAGAGVRLRTSAGAAFAIRHLGRVPAWLKRCARIGVELDWMAGRLRDDSGLYLICATHGAL